MTHDDATTYTNKPINNLTNWFHKTIQGLAREQKHISGRCFSPPKATTTNMSVFTGYTRKN